MSWRVVKGSSTQLISSTEKTQNINYSINYILPTAIIIGSEGDSVSTEFFMISSAKGKILMYGIISPLNLSVATVFILYEVINQRD